VRTADASVCGLRSAEVLGSAVDLTADLLHTMMQTDADPVPSFKLKFGEIKQNNGYYAVQSHSRSPMSVPIERQYATSY